MKKWLMVFAVLAMLLCLPALAEEQVLVDNEALFIRVDGFDLNLAGEPVMNVTLENRTDYNVMFSVRECVVDGCANDPFWAAELAPGETYDTAMAWHDLTEIPTHISLTFYAYNNDDWSADYLLDQPFTFYPLGEENVKLQTYERSETDVVLAETEEVSVIVTGYIPGGDGEEPGVKLHLENRADYTVMFSADRVLTDGMVNDPWWAEELPANCMAESVMSWDSLTALPSVISFEMRVYNSDDWGAADLVNGEYVLYPNGETEIVREEFVPAETDVVLVDTPELLVVVTGFEKDTFSGVNMLLYVENRTEGNVAVAIDSGVVEGLAANPYWGVELPPLSVAREEACWSELKEIPTVVSFVLRAYDTDDWFADDLVMQSVELFPLGEENMRRFTYTPAESDVLLYSSEELNIWVVGYSLDDFWGMSMSLMVENRGDRTLMIGMDACQVDGAENDPIWAMEAPAHSFARADVTWVDLMELPGEITFTLSANDSYNWSADEIDLGSFTVNPVK